MKTVEELQSPRSHEARLAPFRLTDIECATPQDVRHWKGNEPITGLTSRVSNFCLEAQRGWCQVRRCSGRCMRTEDEMKYLAGRDLANEEDEAA